MGHPAVAMAAVIGVPHHKWGERPCLIVSDDLRGKNVTADADHESILSLRIAAWWMPDEHHVPQGNAA